MVQQDLTGRLAYQTKVTSKPVETQKKTQPYLKGVGAPMTQSQHMGLSHSNCTGACVSSVTQSQHMGLSHSNCTGACVSSVTQSHHIGLGHSNCTEACVLSDSVTAYGTKSQ